MKSWKSEKFLWQIWHDQSSMYPPPQMKSWKSENFLWQIWHNPLPQKWKGGNLVNFFMADFAWPKLNVPPPQMKSWKSAEDFLWHIWHAPKFDITPLPPEMKRWKSSEIFYGTFGTTKVQCTPPGNKKLEIEWKLFMAHLAWPQFDVPPCPRNENLEMWQKNSYGRFCMTKVELLIIA